MVPVWTRVPCPGGSLPHSPQSELRVLGVPCVYPAGDF